MTEANMIRSIQRWESEGGRILQPQQALNWRFLRRNLIPTAAERHRFESYKETHRRGCGSQEN